MYTVQSSAMVTNFLRLDWKSQQMQLLNAVVDLQHDLDAVKANVLIRGDQFVKVDHLSECVVNENRDILGAMLCLNIIYIGILTQSGGRRGLCSCCVSFNVHC